VTRRPIVSRVPETAEQAHIVQLTRTLGGTAYVLGTTRRRGDYAGTMQTPGVPDLLLFLPRRDGGREFVAWEVKAAGGRLRPDQARFAGECQAAAVAHGIGGFDAFIAFLVARGVASWGSFAHQHRPATVLPAEVR